MLAVFPLWVLMTSKKVTGMVKVSEQALPFEFDVVT